ncbi:MAG: HAMP domain-containing sensor histidine kinase [Rhodospirillaceae bacterium]|nr:HAMP domain-containing sensor histidine kinase [Rhodospirillaceae bacterium]
MRSLSARLLVLTIFFVMLAEVMIFVPSVARFRESWLNEKLSAAYLAVRTLDVAPDEMVSDRLREELLAHVGVYGINVRRGGAKLILSREAPPAVHGAVDLSDRSWSRLIMDAMAVLTRTEDRVLRVSGSSLMDPNIVIEIVLEERPLRLAVVDFAGRIFVLSLLISLVTATLVFLTLQWMLVRPMRRITDSMTAFREDPEDAQRIFKPSHRTDEIGVAQRELTNMQGALRAALQQKAHLAALGTAVAKINHDLRGILSSALVVSDRLEGSEDTDVRRVTPTLVSAIDRAVGLCSDTLDYVRQEEITLRRERVALAPLVADVANGVAGSGGTETEIQNQVNNGLEVNGDRDQLFRVLTNLTRNAAEAGADHVCVTAKSQGDMVEIAIRDDGPGLPARAREKLFRPFEGSVRAGGTGLGLAIARELARDHRGALSLVDSSENGTEFRLTLPAS